MNAILQISGIVLVIYGIVVLRERCSKKGEPNQLSTTPKHLIPTVMALYEKTEKYLCISYISSQNLQINSRGRLENSQINQSISWLLMAW